MKCFALDDLTRLIEANRDDDRRFGGCLGLEAKACDANAVPLRELCRPWLGVGNDKRSGDRLRLQTWRHDLDRTVGSARLADEQLDRRDRVVLDDHFQREPRWL